MWGATSKTPVFSSLKEAVHLAKGKDVTVVDRQVVHGGDANESYKLKLSDGGALFLKANSISNADFFRAEAEGIAAIKSTKAVRVPDIYAVGTDDGYSFLLMEYVERAGFAPDFWETLGLCLANMHMADTSLFVHEGKYGFQSDNYIGAGVQKNTPKSGWIEFFSECRLRPQFELASKYFDEKVIHC